jgi:hypothetical protein
MRQAFHPEKSLGAVSSSKTQDVNQYRVDPNKPGKLASSSTFKNQMQTSLKSELPMSKSPKLARDTPDAKPNAFGRRNSTPLVPAPRPPAARRHSMDKAPHTNGPSKKKVKSGPARLASKVIGTPADEDENAYFADMEIVDLSQEFFANNIDSHDLLTVFKDAEVTRKRPHHNLEESLTANAAGAKICGKRNKERPNDTGKRPMKENPSKRPQNGHVSFVELVGHRSDNKGLHPVGHIDRDSSPLSSDENDITTKHEGSMEDDDSTDSFHTCKDSQNTVVFIRCSRSGLI